MITRHILLQLTKSTVYAVARSLQVVLAAELGAEFEKDALHFVPELFKCVVITVQIIAESGDAGVRGILHNCHSPRLLPRVIEATGKDKVERCRLRPVFACTE
jgi:CLIP-associating protein 1/2